MQQFQAAHAFGVQRGRRRYVACGVHRNFLLASPIKLQLVQRYWTSAETALPRAHGAGRLAAHRLDKPAAAALAALPCEPSIDATSRMRAHRVAPRNCLGVVAYP